MTIETLDKSNWQKYLDSVSETIAGKRVEIDVTGLRLGDQVQAQQLSLIGLSYDPKDDFIEIMADGLDHRIHSPETIHVDYEIDGLHSIEVIDASELHQIIKFAQPMALPEPVKIKPA